MSAIKPVKSSVVLRAATEAAEAIPPLWPLAEQVAVNPFMGMTDLTLAEVAEKWARLTGSRLLPERRSYVDALSRGAISEDDLRAACIAAGVSPLTMTGAALEAILAEPPRQRSAIPTLADLAASEDATDWPALMLDRFSMFAGGHFDRGQALWQVDPSKGLYASWLEWASHDRTPEILGLGGFCAYVRRCPADPKRLIEAAALALELPFVALESYFQQLLIGLGGWSQWLRGEAWRSGLAGTERDEMLDVLAIRLVWEWALKERHEGRLDAAWDEAVARHAEPIVACPSIRADLLLLDAAERADQRRLMAELRPAAPTPRGRAQLQAVFCIDVRSEVLRRALEALDPDIETRGCAGFFGLPIGHVSGACERRDARAPALLAPQFGTRSTATEAAMRRRAFAAQWRGFKQGHVSAFTFVEAMGPCYIGRLIRDAFGLGSEAGEDAWAVDFDPPLPLTVQVEAAYGALAAMGLVRDFAPHVLLLGHGAVVTNNPQASALKCGACGGHAGDVNAVMLARLLNDPRVREQLRRQHGIDVPADTRFHGGLHDTVSDRVTVLDDPAASGEWERAEWEKIEGWLEAAGQLARAERAQRFGRRSDDSDSRQRGRDWSEVRPEWGLAGCSGFLAAPRSMSRHLDLGGRFFLHDYDPADDADGALLEQILTAPVVVASWISLQYFGSVLAPAHFGAGNKLLHNVVGAMGVLEGNSGALRAGLSRQSLHDGHAFVHEPRRLAVWVRASAECIGSIVEKHSSLRQLFDQGWLSLFAWEADGRILRYRPTLRWEPAKADIEVIAFGKRGGRAG